MKTITVVDARMGRGKTSAAIRYMNQSQGAKKFLYITPYLSEVERICKNCEFSDPQKKSPSKSQQLKALLREGQNIAATHSLFGMMDAEAMALSQTQGYHLIVDESIQMVIGMPISESDRNLIKKITKIDQYGGVKWLDSEYTGVFEPLKELADEGSLFLRYGSFFHVVPPEKFCCFEEVMFLTYLFEGQIQKAYFDYFDFKYEIVGIEEDEEGFFFSKVPDNPPPQDLSQLIHLFGDEFFGKEEQVNEIGDGRTALSKNWYQERRRRSNRDIKVLRRNMNSFFNKYARCEAKRRLWTTFKDSQKFLYGDKNRYKTSFLALNARASNAYKDADCVAYLVNRFVNPNVCKFFASKKIIIPQEKYALGEMLQFIWRSAIREGKEIWVYIPSRRMRRLLKKWIADTSQRE